MSGFDKAIPGTSTNFKNQHFHLRKASWTLYSRKTLPYAPKLVSKTKSSDHKRNLIPIDNCCEVPTSPAPVNVKLKMKNINYALWRHLEVRGQFSLRDVAAIIQQERTRCLQSRRSKALRNYYRERCYWFQLSDTLLKLK